MEFTRRVKLTYREIPQAIINQEPGFGNSVSMVLDSNSYKVYSYSTLIAEIGLDKNIISFNDKYYSNTTSKIQNIIRKIYNIKKTA